MSYTIVYASDHNYINFLINSMGSLLRTNQHIKKLNFCIVNDHLTKEDIQCVDKLLKEFGREYKLVSLEHICNYKNEIEGFPKAAYSKLFVSDVLNCDIALYIDVDTIICGKIDKVLCWKLSSDALAGAVLDIVQPIFKTRVNLDRHSNYYNTGVILWNIKKIKEEHITDKFRKYIAYYYAEHGVHVPHNDQGVFNHVCAGRIDTLLPQFNLMSGTIFYSSKEGKKIFCIDHYYEDNQLQEAEKNPIIIHFTEGYYGRPWNKKSTHPYKQYYISACEQLGMNAFIEDKKLSRRKYITVWVHSHMPEKIFALYIKLLGLRKKIR